VNKLILMFTIAALLVGCNSHYYHEEATSYVTEIKQLLVFYSKCQDLNKCPLIFVSGGAWVIADKPYGGVKISVYEVNELEIIAKILSLSINNHAKHQEVKTTVQIYSTPHLSKDESIVAELNL
jgi:hypothetical protein